MRRPIVCMQIASRSVILIKQPRFPGCRECFLSETFTDLYFLVASYAAEAALPRSRGRDKRFVKPFCYSILRFRYPSYLRYHKSYREITFPILNSVLVIDLTGLWIIFSQQRSSLWIELHKWNIFDFSSFSYILSFDIAFRFLTLSLRVASPPRHFRWTSRCAKTVHRARERSPHRKASCSDGVFRRKNFPQNRVFITF